MYSTSYTGKLDFTDWTLLWTDHLAILFLPVVFLHFCLSFPERKLPSSRSWLIPAAYLPAFAVAGASVASQILFVTLPRGEMMWRITAAIDQARPLYFAALFAVSFGILFHSYRRTRNHTARKQMKWLVWGTGAGVVPFFVFYAIPFAFGREPRFAMELAGYVPLALIPLSLAYAVVKHRLMDVELIFRRTLVYILATAAIVGVCLLVVGLFGALLSGDDEPHVSLIAALSAIVVILLFTPVKSRIQEGIDRLFYKERYNSRRVLLRLSQDLNAELDLAGSRSDCWRGAVRARRRFDRDPAARSVRRLPDLQGRGMPTGVGFPSAPAAERPGDAAARGRAGQHRALELLAVPGGRLPRPGLLLPVPCQGRDHRRPRRRAKRRHRFAEQRGDGHPPGPRGAGRHGFHERGDCIGACARRRTSCRASRSTARISREHGLRDPSSWTSKAASCAGTAPWSPSTASAGRRCWGAPSTTSCPPRSWTRCAAAWCSADRGHRPHLQAPSADGRRAQRDGQRLHSALPGRARASAMARC
jgi:hypothetical protein